MRLIMYAGLLIMLASCASTQKIQEPPSPHSTQHPDRGHPPKTSSFPIRLKNSPFTLTPVSFADLQDWAQYDTTSGLKAFYRSCAQLSKRQAQDMLQKKVVYAGRVGDWQNVCARLPGLHVRAGEKLAFFERNFEPFLLSFSSQKTGLLTGYYEPEIQVYTTPRKGFEEPLLRKPSDLFRLDVGDFIPGFEGKRFIAQPSEGYIKPYPPRSVITRDSQKLQNAFAWGRPVDVFFLQIQGSGRLVFENGKAMRAAFAAHNGHTYRSVGKELIRRNILKPGQASKKAIALWMQEQNQTTRRQLMDFNPRYVFFDLQPLGDPELGPKGAQNVPLQAMTSLAVDPAYHAFGLPVWIEARLPEREGDFKGRHTGFLAITQDQGGAIKGGLRGDLFFGSGRKAGGRAGVMRHQARWVVLLPKSLAQRIKDKAHLLISYDAGEERGT